MADGIHYLGRILAVTGIIIAIIGIFLMLSDKIPLLGKLPGDIVVQRKNFTFYFPLATSIVISLILTIFYWFFGRR